MIITDDLGKDLTVTKLKNTSCNGSYISSTIIAMNPKLKLMHQTVRAVFQISVNGRSTLWLHEIRYRS